ncbi:LuxR C-terminal-related transcriptional regulator [Myroides sp. LJL115]
MNSFKPIYTYIKPVLLLLVVTLGYIACIENMSAKPLTKLSDKVNGTVTLSPYRYSLNAYVPFELESHEFISSTVQQSNVYDFVSGLFYGVLFIAIFATSTMYVMYKTSKWGIFLVFQALLLLMFFFADIAKYTMDPETYFTLPYFENFLLISLVVYLVYLASYFYKFAIQRFVYLQQFKLFSLTTLLGLASLAYHSIIHNRLPLFLYIIVTLLVIVTQVLMQFLIKKRRKDSIYILLLINLIFLYTLSFTDLDPLVSKVNYKETIIALKGLTVVLLLFNMFINYLALVKINTINKTNKVLISQYVSLIRNYHKLLVEEKKQQSENALDLSVLKENTSELEDYLKTHYKLTERELDVLHLIWEGYTNKKISEKLSITLSTAKYHIGNIYIKLNVNSRAQIFALKG